MKHFLSALLMLTLVACQKENGIEEESVVVAPQPQPATVCKIATIQEHPSLAGNNLLREFAYDAANRAIKIVTQSNGVVLETKSINYNANNKIDKVTYNNGTNEVFGYSNNILTGWEAFDYKGIAVKKAVFTYANGHLVREDRYNYNTTSAAYELAGYSVYDWDAKDNIVSIKAYTDAQRLVATDTYTYHADKLNKQQTITPQMELLFMNMSNDITAFTNSKNLLNEVVSQGRSLVYEINESGWVTLIENDKKEKLFSFTYDCTK